MIQNRTHKFSHVQYFYFRNISQQKMIIPNKMNIVPNTNIIIGLFIKCFFSFIIKNKRIIPSILYSINWILIFITSSYYLWLRNFFGWLSPYPIFHKPLFAFLKSPDPIPYVSVMMSHSLSHCDDVRYCTIPQIASAFFRSTNNAAASANAFSFLASSFSNFSFSLRSARSSLPACVPFSLALSFAFIQAS